MAKPLNIDIINALQACQANITRAAKYLSISRKMLYIYIDADPELQTALTEIKQERAAINREIALNMVQTTIQKMFERIKNNEASDAGMLGFIKMFDDLIKSELSLKTDTATDTAEPETGIDFTYEVIESKAV